MFFFYDERGQGKGADAVCSLRLIFHLNKRAERTAPKISISIAENCVGQNKSQTVMKFNCMLSVLFYDELYVSFLKSGHSHMAPDRVWAWCKNSMKEKNIYMPQKRRFKLCLE